jgi:cob(I)alamin adenosyltransferase
MGSMLATPPDKKKLKSGKDRLQIKVLEETDAKFHEQGIDEMNEELPPMTHFILPGGHPSVSYCHVARCVCRRAERIVVALKENEAVEDTILVFLNRLSDYLFVLARKLSRDNGAREIPWKG